MGDAEKSRWRVEQWLRLLWHRMRYGYRRDAVDRETAEEMRFHQEMLVRDALEEGRAPADAVAAARQRFGNELYFRERVRDGWGWRWVDEWMQDQRFALRGIRRNWLVSSAIVLTLGLAIGANTAIFSLLSALLLAPLPVASEGRLVKLERINPAGRPDCCFPMSLIEQMRVGRRSVARPAAYDLTRLNVRTDGGAEPADGGLVSGTMFELLGVRAAAGRLLTLDDDRAGSPPVAVISHGYWTRRFGTAASVLGQAVNLNGFPVTIVGVLPRDFTLAVGAAPLEFWLPLSLHGELALNDHTEFHVYAELAVGATAAAAEAELSRVYAAFMADSLGRGSATRGAETGGRLKVAAVAPAAQSGTRPVVPAMTIRALTPREFAFTLGEEVGEQLRILLVAGLLVLLIVCANIANLLFARGVARQREMSLRLALGSGQWRLLRPMLIESVILGLAGAVLGLVIAPVSGAALLRFLASEYTTPLVDVSPDSTVLAFAAGLAVLAAVTLGLAPAFRASRVDLQNTLKTGSAGAGASRAVLGIGRVLVSAQVALSLLLLVTAGVLLRSVKNLGARDPGYERAQVITFGTHATTLGYEGEREVALYEQLRDRFQSMPGVSGASYHRYVLAQLNSAPCAQGEQGPEIRSTTPVGPGFFGTLGVRLIAGREFTSADGPRGAPVVILRESLARTVFPAGNAEGSTLRIRGPEGFSNAQIVGVVPDLGYRRRAQNGNAPCQVYSPVAQAPSRRLGQMVFIVRTAGPPAAVSAELGRAVRGVEPDLAMRDVQTLESLSRAGFRGTTALATLTCGFSSIALAFAAIGLFAILTYMVASRKRELALRVALGAPQDALVRGIVSEMLRLVFLGALMGVVASIAVVRLTGTFIYGIEPTDPYSIALSVSVVTLVGLIAVYSPARRASRVDPGIVLRAD